LRFETDHKIIARYYLLLSLSFFLIAGLLAMVMRWQLAWPGAVVPLLGQIMPRVRREGGMLPPEVYAEFFSQHGTIMVFFVIIPLLVGAFGTFLVPLQVGARNIAFPRLNAGAFWIHALAGVVILGSFFAPKGAAASGWTAYTPLSQLASSGQNWWIVSLVLFSISQIIMAVCQGTTILNRRASGMALGRMPIFIWNMLATATITLLSTPALMAALIMLLLERVVFDRFFSPVAGASITSRDGQPLLWQHLFWFYAHPAVYIMILPAMGIASEILSVFARKPLFGYRAFVASTWAITFLGFLVWGHHMFQSGMNPYIGTSFMAATMVIAVPSSVKTFNWIATLWGGSIRLNTPLLHGIGFISMFVIGGLSGIFAASTPVDVYIHDTFFIVGHLHYVLFGGSLFAIFAAITFWWPKMFGRMLDERLGKLHFFLTFLAYNGTFFPMFILGIGGMMRRIYDPTQYAHLRPLQPINVFITECAFVLGIAQLVLAANLLLSLRRMPQTIVRVIGCSAGMVAAASLALPLDYAVAAWLGLTKHSAGLQFFLPAFSVSMGMLLAVAALFYLVRRGGLACGLPAPDNPWQANTLEWQISSPPSRTNYAELPIVYRNPYEYSQPSSPAGVDFLPQDSGFRGSKAAPV
jgi:cytochrome c oxidase subunit 1